MEQDPGRNGVGCAGWTFCVRGFSQQGVLKRTENQVNYKLIIMTFRLVYSSVSISIYH